MSTDVLDLQSPAGLLAMQSLPRVGPVTALKAAVQAAHRPEVVGQFDEASLIAAYERIGHELERHVAAGVTTVSFFDAEYPDRFRHLPDPPPVLFIRGDVNVLAATPWVAVVGTREPTVFGTSAAEYLTAALAAGGWGVVSGLATGIDTAAHRAALEHNLPTVAVMGGGLDKIYPSENKDLAARILDAGGALISEQPFGVPPRPNHLVARDRLQSALALAVLVVQCGIKSGTLHTARYAAAQGRPIFCPVPHGENGASEGLRALLERPGRELCSVLPAWRGHDSLCAKLGDRPLAHPVSRDRMAEFVEAMGHLRDWRNSGPDELFGELDED